MSVNDFAFKLGAEVRRRREVQGLTLEGLGDRSGLTPNYIGGVELGRRDPSLSTILALSKGLGVRPGELLGGSGEIGPVGLEAGRIYDDLATDAQTAVMMVLRSMADLNPKKPLK